MKNLLQLMRQYPLEIILSIAFAVLFSKYPEIAMANLFVLVSTLLSCYLALSNLKYFKSLAVLPLIVSLALYYFLPHNRFSFLFVSISVGLILSLVFISMRFGINPRQTKLIPKVLILGLAAMVLMPLTYHLSSYVMQSRESAELISQSKLLESRLIEEENNLKKSSLLTTKDPFISELISHQSYEDLNGYVQNLMISQGLGYLTITDCDGVVIARAHQNKILGDDYRQVVATLKEVEQFSGVYQEFGRVFVSSGQRLSDQSGQCIGFMAIGKMADGALLPKDQTSGYLVGGKILNVNGPDQVATNALERLSDVDDFAGDKLMLVRIDNQQVLNSKYRSERYAIDIISSRAIDGFSVIYITNLVFYLLAVAICYRLLRYRRREFSSRDNQQLAGHTSKKYSEILTVFPKIVCILLFVFVISDGNADEFISRGKDIGSGGGSFQSDFLPSLSLEHNVLAKLSEDTVVSLKLNNLPNGSASLKTTVSYSKEMLDGSSLRYQDGPCDQVYDKSIDNNSGIVSFSCVLKYASANNSSINVFELTFKPKKVGVANFSIQSNETSLRTSRGDSDRVAGTFSDGEKLLVGN